MAKIIFLMGVSGSGKTTVLQESHILQDPTYRYVQSYTTRPMRPGEVNGEKYWHIGDDEFQQARERGEFLECALVHQSYWYGTKYDAMMLPLEEGVSTIKELEMYGLQKIQEEGKINGLYHTIFLDIPTEVMVERITSRSPVSDDELAKRVASADFERTQAQERCDVLIDATQPLELVVKTFIDTLNRFDSE